MHSLPPMTKGHVVTDVFAVPDSFPRPSPISTLPGSVTKFVVEQYEGKFYPAGGTPPQLHADWCYCEDLAQQFKEASLDTKAGKRAHMREADILDLYLLRLLETNWGTPAQMRWVIQRAASLLGWQAPPNSLLEPEN
ncbi:hypothetical protein GCM10011396_53700 [Undibacterium terreum]|uniref:Uncharacterized protein n=1 Tax=Undibacterium terreum TaxID=1224302 RepID=A0A916V0N2_9BURK|nr:hypothetical protein GCM10011396_53700 [Undibacterium terreum]